MVHQEEVSVEDRLVALLDSRAFNDFERARPHRLDQRFRTMEDMAQCPNGIFWSRFTMDVGNGRRNV